MNYDQWREWWTSRASTYFTDKAWKFSRPDLINRLNIGKDSCVLEIGFGYGRELSQFCELSNNVYGVELDKWSCDNTLKELMTRGVRALPRLSAYDGETLPYPNESFDAVYSCFVVQHLSREHAKRLIREALRVVRTGGRVLFEFFGDPAFRDSGADVFSGKDGEGGMFNNAYISDEIPHIIAECGGVSSFMDYQQITKKWGNYWSCFRRTA